MKRLLFLPVLLFVLALPLLAQGDDEETVTPLLDCVLDLGNDRYVAYFTYENESPGNAMVMPGEENFLEPAIEGVDVPGIFSQTASGRLTPEPFVVPFDGSDLTWTVLGQSVTVNADSTPCPLEANATIQVDMDNPRQVITGFGGAYVLRFSKSFGDFEENRDLVAEYTFENIQPTHMRFDIPLDAWEPVNDNDDPDDINLDAYNMTPRIAYGFDLMQRAQERGITLLVSLWDVPEWMLENPEDARQLILLPGMRAEAIEAITAFLLTARDEYGVAVDYISLNENDLGVNLLLTPDEQVDFILAASERFAEADLETRWVIGDTSNMEDATEYISEAWANADVQQYVDVWATHSWDANVPDGTLRRLYEQAQSLDLPFWMTETGWDPLLWETPEDFPTWNNAIEIARLYSRLYAFSGVNVPFYWQMLDDYRLMSSDAEEQFQSYHVIDQMRQNVPVGSQIMTTTTNGAALYHFAAQTPDGDTVVQVVNTDPLYQSIAIEELPNGTYYHTRISEEETPVLIDSYEVTDGRLEINVMASSINIFTTQAPE